MKTRLISSSLFLIVLIPVALLGCKIGTVQDKVNTIEDSDYTIRVISAPQGKIPLPPNGLSYEGNYSVTTSEGQISSFSVSGIAPNEFVVKGIRTSGTFRKLGERGRLTVEITKGDKVVASSYTTNLYGVVHVASP